MRKVKNAIRSIFKIRFFENILVKFTQGKTYDSLFVKLVPSNITYSVPTFRKAVRDGITYKLDISDYMDYALYYGIQSEPRDKLYGLVKEGFVVFDVGTNIGETLLGFAQIIGNKGKVYGFEPVPYLHERAKTNIGLNNFNNIHLFNVALSDKEETLSFTPTPNQNSSGIAMRKKTDEGYVGTQVSAFTLDSFVASEQIAHIDMIKIDVEGFEFNVLQGALETLKTKRPILVIEVDDNNLQRQNVTAKQLLEFLSNTGYKLADLQTEKALNMQDSFQNCHFDVLCVPK